MKTVDIVGENYFGSWDKSRTACRGLIQDGANILLSYEAVTDQWMIPGGGLEDNESDSACCIREIAEETGILTEVSDCVLEINEYYENWKWVSRYFIGKAVGQTEIKQTKREQEVGMVPRWIPVQRAKEIFSMHASYTATDEIQ